MMYLTGATNDRDEPALIERGVGIVLRPGNSYHLRVGRYPFFGADIGMGWRDADEYLSWLDGIGRDRCIYAVSPDVYPDAVASLERGMTYAGLIREMGFPVALVAQDDAEKLTWPWDEFDVLFIGGERKARPDDEWKVSAAAASLARRARDHGKWVHMGRVNSIKRLEKARAMGCNSADGTFVKHRRRHRLGEAQGANDRRGASELGEWLNWLDAHPSLPGFTTFEMPSHPTHREAAR